MLTMRTSDWSRAQKDQAQICRQIRIPGHRELHTFAAPSVPGHAGLTLVIKRRFDDIYRKLSDKVKSYTSEFFETQLIPENREIWQSKFAAGLPSHVVTALSAPEVGHGSVCSQGDFARLIVDCATDP
jgi:hypothetical protein